jgi:hypothetical protein
MSTQEVLFGCFGLDIRSGLDLSLRFILRVGDSPDNTQE